VIELMPKSNTSILRLPDASLPTSNTTPTHFRKRLSARTIIACIGGALAFGAHAQLAAAPIDPSIIHADANWAFHLDTEAANGSELSKRMKELDPEGMSAESAIFEVNFGVDFERDIFGLTVYGVESPEQTVVIIDARKSAAATIPAFLDSQPLTELTHVTESGYLQHRWMLGDRRFVMVIAPGSNDDRSRIFIGPTPAEVLRAVGVASGKLSSQASLREPRLKFAPRAQSFVYVTMRGPIEGAANATAMIFRNAKSMTIDLGETAAVLPAELPASVIDVAAVPADAAISTTTTTPANPPPTSSTATSSIPASSTLATMYVDMQLVSNEPKYAIEMSQVVQGLVSLAKMQVAGDQRLTEVLKLLDSVRVEVQDNTVRLQTTHESSGLAKFLTDPAINQSMERFMLNPSQGIAAHHKTAAPKSSDTNAHTHEPTATPAVKSEPVPPKKATPSAEESSNPNSGPNGATTSKPSTQTGGAP